MDKPDNNALAMPGHAPKGIVDPAGAARRIRLATYPPCPPLAPFIDYFWVVAWDLLAPHIQRVLPYPNAHLVFERGSTALHGVVRGAFERRIDGKGQVLGVRFKPGGLRPFIEQPLAQLTGRTASAAALLQIDAGTAERLVFDAEGDAAQVAAATALLLAVLPKAEQRAQQAGNVARIALLAEAAGGPVSVAALAAQAGLGERALQRLFSDYVGVSPKWVIQRYRLQEATWLLARAGPIDLAGLAAQLGFFDQSHFTRDFTRLVGCSPLAYWRSQQAAADPT